MVKYYAGIGSRETPTAILSEMTRLAQVFQSEGYILRSGAAEGADTAFELGAGDAKHIYLPWPRFNGHSSTLLPTPEAYALAAKHHPAWDRCSPGARSLHARNCHQVLGLDLATPVEFVCCWTKDGRASGGTGQAIRLAYAFDVHVEFLS